MTTLKDGGAIIQKFRDAMSELKVWAEGERNKDYLPFLIGPLCHYTNARGLEGILKDRELWATNYLHLNDPKEFEFGRDILQDTLRLFRRNAEEESISPCLAKTIEDSATLGPFELYIASFSRNGDDLSQWRAYGDDGRGVCIEFTPYPFANASIPFGGGAVLYGEEYARSRQVALVVQTFQLLGQHGVLDEFNDIPKGDIEGMPLNEILKPFQECFVWNSLSLKHEAYLGENELRFVVADPDMPIKTRVRGSEIVPYIPLKLSLRNGGIAQIRLGPAAHPRARDGILHLLRQYKYSEDIEVSQSTIPYRSL
jgi:hypothetical protein